MESLKRIKLERGTRKSLSTKSSKGNHPLLNARGLQNHPGPDLDPNPAGLASNHPLKKYHHGLNDDVPKSGRQVVKRFSNPEAIRSNIRGNFSHGISRREILERRRENPEKFTQTLQHWKPGIENDRRNSYAESRPQTLPSIGKLGYNQERGFPIENRRISRQEILNRRTSFEAPKTPVQVAIRRKANSLLEPPSRIIFNPERKDESRLLKSSAYVKNAGSSCNTGKRREGFLDRREGARSVADFLTVSNRLRDDTRGLVPRPSTLPKIVHTTRNLPYESHYNIALRQPKESASREAPIYGKIRRRKLSLPAISRESILRKSTGSLQYYRDLDADSIKETPIRSYRNLAGEMKLDCKKISGTILRKSASKPAGQDPEDKADGGDKKGPTLMKDRAISRRRIINSVEESKEGNDKFRRTRDRDKDSGDVASAKESNVIRRSVNESDNKIKGVAQPKNSNLRVSTWHNVKSRSTDANAKNKSDAKQTHSTTLPLYMKSVRKTSSCTSSSIPTKIASRTAENRQPDTKTSRLEKFKKSGTVVKATKHSRSLSDINSTRSVSPAPSSSIFGFCTGRRKVQITEKKSQDADKTKEFVKGDLKLRKVGIFICFVSFFFLFIITEW